MLLHAEMQDNNMMKIVLTDWGIPFDPDDAIPFNVDAPIENRISGGMGLYFITSLMDEVTHEPTPELGDPNVLTLVKRVERLQAGAHQASAARELNAMLSVSRIMTAQMEIHDLLEWIINELVETIDAERGTMYLVDDETGELYSYVLSEETGDVQEIRVKIGEGVAGYVGESGKVLNIHKAYDDPRFLSDIDHKSGYETRTMLVAPMQNYHEEIIGVVQLLNKKGGDFTTRDERLITAMAAQAAIRIENARLYTQEMQQQLIDQELDTARTIQNSFLPSTIPQHSNWDLAAYWRPMREVGGDFYDFYRLPDGRLGILVADVSGKRRPQQQCSWRLVSPYYVLGWD